MKRVLNFMRNPELAHVLVFIEGLFLIEGIPLLMNKLGVSCLLFVTLGIADMHQ